MRTPAILTMLIVAACAPLPGVVSDFNGSSVKIRQETVANVPGVTPQIEEEAARICATAKKKAEYASTLSAPTKEYAEHLFLCL